MWQEIVAIDTKLNEHRMMEAKDLRPLYLKRRLQLLQNKAQTHHNQQGYLPPSSRKSSVVSHPECPDPDQYVMRNRKYISLRVKLLKKQFGLPSDLVSLRSLSLSPALSVQASAASNKSVSFPGQNPETLLEKSSNHHGDGSSYNGVHYVIELEQAPLASGTRLLFRLLGENSGNGVPNYEQESLLFANDMGQIISNELRHQFGTKVFQVTTKSTVTDYDVNDSNELLVGAGQDGSFVAWNLQSGLELRRIQFAVLTNLVVTEEQKRNFLGLVSPQRRLSQPVQPQIKSVRRQLSVPFSRFKRSDGLLPRGVFVIFCRFLPRNNNLIICALSNGVLQVLNISTGKFNHDCHGAPMLGKTLAVALNATGSVLWAGNDRGYIESFRIDSTTGKLQKGCRVQANSFGKPVKSLTARTSISKLTQDPCLLATFEDSDQLRLYRISDDYGTIVPFKSFSSGSEANLKCAIMAPILSYRPGTIAVAGAEDGSLLFFDLERDSRPCINKLLGHSGPVVALGFSNDESLLASADEKNQIIIWRKS